MVTPFNKKIGACVWVGAILGIEMKEKTTLVIQWYLYQNIIFIVCLIFSKIKDISLSDENIKSLFLFELL